MRDALPIEATWDQEAGVFRPTSPYMTRRADKQFGAGEVLHLVDEPERSLKSHQHFFASVNEAWKNLGPLESERFPSAEHLRRYALIKSGFCNSHSLNCGSPDAARRAAKFIRPMDEFQLVTVEGCVVHVFTAKSQSYRAMGKAEFQRSKDEVLRVVAELIGVSRRQLTDNTGKAA